MNPTGIPYLDLAWNPCGFGCSRGCLGCWAREIAARFGKCPDCRAFKPHFHPERLAGKFAPAATKRPAVVGVQFCGDLWDPERLDREIIQVLNACADAPHHTFVFLTQQPARMAEVLRGFFPLPANWWCGATVRNQEQTIVSLHILRRIQGHTWASAEPLDSRIPDLWPGMGLSGVIIGHNNKPDGPGTGTIQYVEEVAAQASAAGVPVYIKQLWFLECANCQGREGEQTCHCTHPDWRKVLGVQPDHFPQHLRLRYLPWKLLRKGATR